MTISFFWYHCWPVPIIVCFSHLKPAAVALQQITLCINFVHSHGTPQLPVSLPAISLRQKHIIWSCLWQPPKKRDSKILHVQSCQFFSVLILFGSYQHTIIIYNHLFPNPFYIQTSNDTHGPAGFRFKSHTVSMLVFDSHWCKWKGSCNLWSYFCSMDIDHSWQVDAHQPK